MFPIRDHNPSLSTPWVTWAIIVANVLVFLSYVPLFTDERALNLFFWDWGLVPARVTHGEGLTGLFTAMFLHGGLLHLAGNMLFFWIFGDNLEDRLGHFNFLLFYLASGLGAAALQILPAPDSQVPMVGASGAIAGVMGGYLLLFPRARVDVLVIIVIFIKIFSVPAWLMLGFWFALQVINGIISSVDMGGVAYWAHTGGFLVGILWVLPVWLRLGGPAFWNRTEGRPENPEAYYRYVQSSVPKVRRRR